MWAEDVKWHTQNAISCTAHMHSCPVLSPIHQTAFTVMAFYSLYKGLNIGSFLEKVVVPTDATGIAGRDRVPS